MLRFMKRKNIRFSSYGTLTVKGIVGNAYGK